MDPAMRLGALEKAVLSTLCEKGTCARGCIEKCLRASYLLAGESFPRRSFPVVLKRLKRKGLIQMHTLFPRPVDPNEIGNIFSLTEEGVKIAEKLPKPEEIIWEATVKRKTKKAKKEMLQQVYEIAKQAIEKQGYITASQIKQTAWEKYGSKYRNRKEFEKIWSEDRIGRILRKLEFKSIKTVKGRKFWGELPLKLTPKDNFSPSSPHFSLNF